MTSAFDEEGFQLGLFCVGCTSDSMTARNKPRKNKRRFGREAGVTSCETLGLA